MEHSTVMIGVCTLAASALLTGLVRRYALLRGVLDIPNARSSHTIPTPRGGGIAIVLAGSVATCALACVGTVQTDILVALLGGGAAVALVGFLDDRYSLPASIRLAVHLGAALWALAWIGIPSALRFGSGAIPLGWASVVLVALGIVWTLNLFNFMDGIDGIAASEAIFIGWGGAFLALTGGDHAVAALGLVFGAACVGFLAWNWPPAKIFMGDVGSGYLGYVIAVVGLAATRSSPSAVWVWLILGGVFFVDATITLSRRAARGERVFEAHRSHAYQWLARRWASHKKVTVGLLAINILWLFPCAYIATLHPRSSLWIVWIALIPLVMLTLLFGAGRPEGGRGHGGNQG